MSANTLVDLLCCCRRRALWLTLASLAAAVALQAGAVRAETSVAALAGPIAAAGTGGCVDADGDGSFAPPCGQDCDDSNPRMFPGNWS